MANKVYNLAGGLHSAAAYAGWENELFGGNAVASQAALQVSAGSGMTVSVGKGNALIDTGDDYSRRIALTEAVSVTLDQADTSLPRNDLIVIYVDMAVSPVQTVQDNTNGILKVVAVKGTPASSPSDPDAGTIQQTIGAGNPYMTLASIRVNAGASAISSGNITDKRPTSPNVYWTTSQIEQIADQQIGDLGSVVHTTASGAFGMQMSLTRAGNIVTLYMFGSISGNIPVGSISFSETVPSGYRPAYATGWVTIDVLNFSPSAAGRVSVGTDGKMTGYMYSQAPSGCHVALSAVYATNDSWPS